MGKTWSDKHMDNYSDDRLIALIRSGDGNAFNTLAERYLSVIRAKASVYRGAKTELEDFIQEGFISFIHAVKSFDSTAGASFSTYVGVCIQRRFLSVYKSEKRAKDIPQECLVPLSDSSLQPGGGVSRDPEQELIDAESYQAVMRHIKSVLSPFELQVLSYYLSGHTYAQTAKALGTHPKAVDNALQRIRKKLRSV